MSSLIVFANNAQTTLAAAIDPQADTIQVAAGTGALFPQVTTGGNYFRLTFLDAATQAINEIVTVTNVSGDIFTVTRAQEGTTALNWNLGDIAANLITAGTFQALYDEIDAEVIAYLHDHLAAIVDAYLASVLPGLIAAWMAANLSTYLYNWGNTLYNNQSIDTLHNTNFMAIINTWAAGYLSGDIFAWGNATYASQTISNTSSTNFMNVVHTWALANLDTWIATWMTNNLSTRIFDWGNAAYNSQAITSSGTNFMAVVQEWAVTNLDNWISNWITNNINTVNTNWLANANSAFSTAAGGDVNRPVQIWRTGQGATIGQNSDYNHTFTILSPYKGTLIVWMYLNVASTASSPICAGIRAIDIHGADLYDPSGTGRGDWDSTTDSQSHFFSITLAAAASTTVIGRVWADLTNVPPNTGNPNVSATWSMMAQFIPCHNS